MRVIKIFCLSARNPACQSVKLGESSSCRRLINAGICTGAYTLSGALHWSFTVSLSPLPLYLSLSWPGAFLSSNVILHWLAGSLVRCVTPQCVIQLYTYTYTCVSVFCLCVCLCVCVFMCLLLCVLKAQCQAPWHCHWCTSWSYSLYSCATLRTQSANSSYTI